MKFHHMDPYEAVNAHVDLSAKQSIAMHFGTFQMADEGINDPVTDLNLALTKYKLSSDDFLVLDEGETVAY
jgi:L-ascorbate metabolism protein UlaG (beta-lactamase superfamily)